MIKEETMSRAWNRYTAQERYEYELEIRRLRIAMVIVCGMSLAIGFFLGRVC